MLSQECQTIGVHPAQGLRVGQRCYRDSYNQLLLQPTRGLAINLAANIQKYLNENTNINIRVHAEPKPEHFLLETQLPQPLKNASGYISPVLNVQPDIHFIRTQRRYNKRRYARVRAISRPSF